MKSILLLDVGNPLYREIAAQVEELGIDLFPVVTYYESCVEAQALLSARFGLRCNSLDTPV